MIKLYDNNLGKNAANVLLTSTGIIFMVYAHQFKIEQQFLLTVQHKSIRYWPWISSIMALIKS